jgi:HSP20 family protein
LPTGTKEDEMAERNALTPWRQQSPLGLSRSGRSETNPFRALQRMSEAMDRMFDDFSVGRSWRSPLWSESGGSAWGPDVDVFTRNNEVTVRADLPGMRREDVNVEVTDDAVIIQGERKFDKDEERDGVYRSERSYGSFYRAVPLPEGAMTDQAKANFKDGVLEVTMPCPPAPKGRKLEITEGEKK